MIVVIISAWLGTGLGCWLLAMAIHPQDRRPMAFALLPVVMIAWPIMVYEMWTDNPFA